MWRQNAYDGYDDEPVHRRYALRLAELLRKTSLLKISLVPTSLTLVYVLYCLFAWMNGDVDVATNQILASAHYKLSPYDTQNYRVIDTRNDQSRACNVSEHVVQARSAIQNSNKLSLILEDNDAQLTTTTTTANAVECVDFLNKQHSSKLWSMMYEANDFLINNKRANENNQTSHQQQHDPWPCVCGPQLGYNYNYMAVIQKSTSTSDKVIESIEKDNNALDKSVDGTATDTDVSGGAKLHELDDDYVVVHFFNLQDKQADAYDQLDGDALALNDIMLGVRHDVNENYRYNVGRGSFSLIYRKVVRLNLMDRHCHSQKVTMHNSLAFCTERCLDQLRGIDVRQRAFMQHERGVRLNTVGFEKLIGNTGKARDTTEL